MLNDEAHIQADIVKFLRTAGVFVHSVPNEAPGSNAIRQGQMITMGLFPGVADLVAWLPSGIAYIEVKTETGKLSPRQEKFRARCAEYGVPYYVVRSVSDVERIMLDASNVVC